MRKKNIIITIIGFMLMISKLDAEKNDNSLIKAAGSSDIKQVEKLISSGINVNFADENGVTALMNAVGNGHSGHLQIINLLVNAGANVNAQDKNKHSVLIYAARSGNLDSVAAILRTRAKLNVQDDTGNTALMYIARENFSDLVLPLIQSGADIHLKNKSSETALDIAALNDYVEIEEILINAGGKYNISANEFNTRGMNSYNNKDYKSAVRFFKRAISVDSAHKFANYNLACTYALMPYDPCNYEDAPPVLDQLEKSLKIDPSVKVRALKDKDFEKYRYNIDFLKTLGALPDKNDIDSWIKILASNTWYNGDCSGGVYGCSYFKFDQSGHFKFRDINITCSATLSDEDCTSKQKASLSGTYRVENGYVILRFDSGDSEKYLIYISGMENVTGKVLKDTNPDDCGV